MNKLHRVFILLFIFLGLGVPCAWAAHFVSFYPQTVEMHPGISQDIKIVMDEVPDGLSGFNITVSVSNPEIAEITAVSFPDWGMWPRNSTIPSNSIWIKTADLDNKVRAGDTNVLLGIITLTGKKAGTADLSILRAKISDDNGSLINPNVITGNLKQNSTEVDQGFDQKNIAVNVEQTSEPTQSPSTSSEGSKKTPGFEIIYGIVSLLSAFLLKGKQ
jgi:hypothetical protein